jgi:hypothetical protein
MGVLNVNNVAKAKTILNRLGRTFNPIDFSVSDLRTYTISDGKSISDATVSADNAISQLQITVMDEFRQLLSHEDVKTSMFYSPPNVADISTYWVEEYYENNLNRFRPHITLGEGRLKQLKKPIYFNTNRLALCHLGSYCTCRDILAEVSLADV